MQQKYKFEITDVETLLHAMYFVGEMLHLWDNWDISTNGTVL